LSRKKVVKVGVEGKIKSAEFGWGGKTQKRAFSRREPSI
jgi:hypothetical protein